MSIESSAENQFLLSNLLVNVWVGASDTATEGQWRWSSTGQQFWQGGAGGSTVGGAHRNWGLLQPDNFLNQDCGVFRGGLGLGKWSDESCSILAAFVCEGDLCPADPNKTEPGQCGCGNADTDADSDGTADCVDACASNPNKTAPGVCGCDANDVDTDADGTLDCEDRCPSDVTKVAPGDCGCADAPAPSGTACDDGFCADNTQCNGAGVCGGPTECDAPDTQCELHVRAGTPYWFCDNDRGYADAQQRCQAAGMTLATIETAGEDAFVSQHADEHSFLGGADQAVEGSWVWLSTGQQFWQGDAFGSAVNGAYKNFAPLEPSALLPGNDCLIKSLLAGGAWKSHPCDFSDAYVCERKDERTLITADASTFEGPWEVQVKPSFSSATQGGINTIVSSWRYRIAFTRNAAGATVLRVEDRQGLLDPNMHGVVVFESRPLTFAAGAALTLHVDPGTDRLTVEGASEASGAESLGAWSFTTGEVLRFGGDRGAGNLAKSAVGIPTPSLISAITLDKTQACAGEPIHVAVTPSSNDVRVRINGVEASDADIQLSGVPGPRHVTVTASNGERGGVRTLEVEVRDCGFEVYPEIGVSFDARDPDGVELVVRNAEDLEGAGREFVWSFGDGQSETTPWPHLRHSYAGSMDADTQYMSFNVSVTVRRDGEADVAGNRTISMNNLYAALKQAGSWQPPAVYGARLTRSAEGYRAHYAIHNRESLAVQYTSRKIETRPCDPDYEPRLVSEEAVSVSVGAQQIAPFSLLLPESSYTSDSCGIAVELTGTAPDGKLLYTPLYFDLPRASIFTVPVADQAVIDLLDDVSGSGLVANPDSITEGELDTLYEQGRIDFVPTLDDVDSGALQAGGDPVGQPCVPGDPLPRIGVTCQTTGEWTVSPALVRNARQGEAIATGGGCGPIGVMLRTVDPPQSYTHTGMMTRNFYALSHNTLSESFLERHTEAVILSDLTEDMAFPENALRFGWPGVVHQSVSDAFRRRLTMLAPDGQTVTGVGFVPAANLSADCGPVVAPLVVRPRSASPALRALLAEAAAAAAADSAHYRTFAYSDALIVDDPAQHATPGQAAGRALPGMCSGFVWQSFRSAGATLEGDPAVCADDPAACLEAIDTDLGDGRHAVDLDPAAVGHPGAYVDGLYFYTAAERRNAGQALKNQVSDKLFDKWEFYKPLPYDDMANQATNCFARDRCGEDDDGEEWQDTVAGQTVSPDDMAFNWDGPETGGVYGHREPLNFAEVTFQRRYEWAGSAGGGSLTGLVRHNGQPVTSLSTAVDWPAARVEFLAPCSGCSGEQLLETSLNADGTFAFDWLPAGTYAVRALARFDGNGDGDFGGGLDTTLFVERDVTIIAGAPTDVVLDLATDDGPTGRLTGSWTRARIEGFVHQLDHDAIGPNDPRDFPLGQKFCEVSPLKRIDWVGWGQEHEMCTDGEIWSNLLVKCELVEPDGPAVRITVFQELHDGGGCSNPLLGSQDTFFHFGEMLPGEVVTHALATNEGGDRATANLTVTIEDGPDYDVDPRGDMEVLVTQGDIVVFDDDGSLSPSDDQLHQLWAFTAEAPAHSSGRTLNERSICVDDEVKARFTLLCDWGIEVNCEAKFMVHEGTECLPDGVPTTEGSPVEPGDTLVRRSFSFTRHAALGLGEGADASRNLRVPDQEGSFANFGFRVWKELPGGAAPMGH